MRLFIFLNLISQMFVFRKRFSMLRRNLEICITIKLTCLEIFRVSKLVLIQHSISRKWNRTSQTINDKIRKSISISRRMWNKTNAISCEFSRSNRNQFTKMIAYDFYKRTTKCYRKKTSFWKKNENFRNKTELIAKENENLKKLLSKKMNCFICEKLYSKFDDFYLHFQFDDEKHRNYVFKRYDIKCDTCSRKFKKWNDFRKHMTTYKLKMSKTTNDLDIENDTNKFFVAIYFNSIFFRSKLTFQTFFVFSKQHTIASKNQINLINE